MADKKISQLTSATTPLAGTEVLPIVQGSTTVKVSVDNLTSNKAVSVGTLTSNGLVTVNSSTVDPYWSSQLQLIGNATYNPKQILWSTHGYRWSIRNNDVGGAGEFVIRYEEGAVDAVSIDRLANTTFTGGNLVQGTAAKGINFTANSAAAGMTSQLLNWYEEGTWTLGLTTAGGNFSSISVNVQTAKFTRIGRTVVVSGSFYTNGTVSGGSGQVYITGLPYSGSDGAVGNVWVNPDTGNYFSPSALPTGGIVSGTQFRLFKNGTTNNPAFASTDLATSGNANNIYFTVSYQV